MEAILVTDRRLHKVVAVDLSTGSRGTITVVLGGGNSSPDFNEPCGIAVDTKSRIYVADSLNHRIVRIDDSMGSEWISYGSKGSGVGHFNRPTGICLDAKARIYVADMLNHRIVRLNDMSGNGWVSYGTRGAAEVDGEAPSGKFARPVSVTLDDQERILVADMDNSRIVRMDDMQGRGWAPLWAADCPVGSLRRVVQVAADNRGRYFAVDMGNHRVVCFSQTGQSSCLDVVAPTAGIFPSALALGHGRTFVLDTKTGGLYSVEESADGSFLPPVQIPLRQSPLGNAEPGLADPTQQGQLRFRLPWSLCYVYLRSI